MNIIAVDDEILALEELEEAISEAAPECKVSIFSNSGEALSYAKNNSVDVAFLDIEMSGMNGMELSLRLKEINPVTNIIFVTGYSQYAVDAHSIYVSGYLLKPFTSKDIAKAIENLRFPLDSKPKQRVKVRCFGNFEVYIDGKPLHFPRSKSKELFAYLIYKYGTSCTVGELAAALLEGKDKGSIQMQQYIFTMMRVFKEHKAEDVIIKSYNSLAVDIDKVDCDYYRSLNGDKEAKNAYTGEYMFNYEWGEHMVGYLNERLK